MTISIEEMRRAYVVTPPKPAGMMEMFAGTTTPVLRKPSRWHRFWMRALLGWKWRDA